MQEQQQQQKQQEQHSEEHLGLVLVDKLPGRFAGQKWPVVAGYKNINVCSSSPGQWKQLSPMKLGPIYLEDFLEVKDDYGFVTYGISVPKSATCLENLWQFSKVFEEDVGKDGWPTKEWFQRRNRGWGDAKAHRRVPDRKGSRVMYSLWGSAKLSYMEARARIYCPIYAALVIKTGAYRALEKLLSEGTKLQLLGYDGYRRGAHSLSECFRDESRPFGHELVLECLLVKATPWEAWVAEVKPSQ